MRPLAAQGTDGLGPLPLARAAPVQPAAEINVRLIYLMPFPSAKLDLKRKVPKVYSYFFTPGELREIAGRHPHVVSVEYVGISPRDQVKDGYQEIWLGSAKGQRVSGRWEFGLRIYANRTAVIEPVQDLAKETFLAQVSSWIEVQRKQPETAPHDINELYVSIRQTHGKYVPSSFERHRSEWADNLTTR